MLKGYCQVRLDKSVIEEVLGIGSAAEHMRTRLIEKISSLKTPAVPLAQVCQIWVTVPAPQFQRFINQMGGPGHLAC